MENIVELDISPARILVIDDRPENLMVLDALLEPLGQPVIKALSGVEALRMLLLYDFAVVLLDVQLPDISGFEVAEMIKKREKTRNIPIIFVTAVSTDFDNIKLGYSTGAVDYISKPFNPDILRSKVSVFIDLYIKGEQIKSQAERLRISALREADQRRQEKEYELERKHHEELSAAYDREKRIADVLQRSFLLAPPEDTLPGVSVAARYQAASDEANIGGDFFDAFTIGTNKVALIVGDVTGKGLQAAARTAEVKYSLRAFLRDGSGPQETLSRLNSVIIAQWKEEKTLPEQFVCVSIATFEAGTRYMECCCAGMEAPVILGPDGNCDVIEVHGMPLGVDIGAEYDLHRYTVKQGEILVMVTDGITEARTGKEFFGIEGVTGVLTTMAGSGSVNDLADTILTDARQFAGGTLKDDACVIAARFEAAPCTAASSPAPPDGIKELGECAIS